MQSSMHPCIAILVITDSSSDDDDDDGDDLFNADFVMAIGIIAAVGTLSLIIVILVFVIILHRLRKNSRKVNEKAATINPILQSTNITSANIQWDIIQNNARQLQHDHSDSDVLSQGAQAECGAGSSRLETINGLYMSTKVKSLDSLLRMRNDYSISVFSEVTICPNPSYIAIPNPSQTRNNPEQEYDYVGVLGADDGATQQDKFDNLHDQYHGPAISNRLYNDTVTDTVDVHDDVDIDVHDNVDVDVHDNIDVDDDVDDDDYVNSYLNPSYTLPQCGQDTKPDDNSLYDRLQFYRCN